MSLSIEAHGQYVKDSCNHLTKFYGRRSLYPVPVSLFPGSVDFPSCSKGSVSHLWWSHSAVSCHCMQITIQTKVEIMRTNIPSIDIEFVVRFSGRGLPQQEMSRNTGVSQGAILKVLCHVCETSSLSQGLGGHQLKMITSKEDRILLQIIREQISVEPIRRMGL